MRKNIFTKIAAVAAANALQLQHLLCVWRLSLCRCDEYSYVYMLGLHGRNTGLTRAYITQEM